MEIRDIVAEKATDNLVLVKYYNVTEGAYKSFFMTFDEFDKVDNIGVFNDDSYYNIYFEFDGKLYTVQELIEILNQVEDKSKEVRDSKYGILINGIYESEIDNCIYIN